jgi:hypothetical protein
MPRRQKTFIAAGKILINGGRREFVGISECGEPLFDVPLDEAVGDAGMLRQKVAAHVQNFKEFAGVKDQKQLIYDIAYECGSAMALRLDHVTRGSRTKPDEWTTQVLVRGVSSVMKKHGLRASLSKYYRRGEEVESLYFRVIPGIIKIAGFRVPGDLKGLCLRAKRIQSRVKR